MSNIDSIISTVLSDYSKFRSVIDEDSIYREVILSIKEFGKNATEDFETVLFIEKGMVHLPSNFYKLEASFLCDNEYNVKGNTIEIRTLIETSHLAEIKEINATWGDCYYCQDERGWKVVNNNKYRSRIIKDGCYANFKPVKITKAINRDSCVPKCINYLLSSKYEISVDRNRNKIKANFNEGFLYIKYRGFPIDDSGGIDFADTANSNMERFLEYAIRTKIAESLAFVEGGQGVASLLTYYIQQRQFYRTKAKTEMVSSKYDSEHFEKVLRRANRMDYMKNSVFGKR